MSLTGTEVVVDECAVDTAGSFQWTSNWFLISEWMNAKILTAGRSGTVDKERNQVGVMSFFHYCSCKNYE